MNIYVQVQRNPGFDSSHPEIEWPIIVFVKNPARPLLGSWLYAKDIAEAKTHIAALKTEAETRRDNIEFAWLDRLKPAA